MNLERPILMFFLTQWVTLIVDYALAPLPLWVLVFPTCFITVYLLMVFAIKRAADKEGL